MQQTGEFNPPLASELNKTNHSCDTQIEKQEKSSDHNHCQSNGTNTESLCSETCESANAEAAGMESVSSAVAEVTKELTESTEDMRVPVREEKTGTGEDNGRERLKRHRIEVAGRVWIPDIWGQEGMLKDWIDCSAFDSSLVPTDIMSARASLVQEGRRANSGGLRIENRDREHRRPLPTKEIEILSATVFLLDRKWDFDFVD